MPLPDIPPAPAPSGPLASPAAAVVTADPAPGWLDGLKLGWQFLFDKPAHTVPSQPVPVQPLSRADLLAAPDASLWRLGHSTVLLKLRGRFWLTDPVFSERASPVQWLGPRRFHAPPIALADLPPLEAVILSHDHYDHLDHAAILALQDRTRWFIAPTGVGDLLIDWGVPATQVRQLAWWQATELGGLELVATPAQHFSGRGLTGRNRTLWASWVLREHPVTSPDGLRLFFSGDSGYFQGFAEIGKRYGPFDLTMVEAGAYDRRWQDVHMRPAQTVQAHRDLQGRWLLPIHNGTFDLAFHAWQEPLEQVRQIATAQGLPVTTPRMGERLDLRQPHPGSAWWPASAAPATPLSVPTPPRPQGDTHP